MTWATIDQRNEVHVIPVDDLFDHSPDDCECGPETNPVERDDGSIGYVITHHSLDGREQHEVSVDA